MNITKEKLYALIAALIGLAIVFLVFKNMGFVIAALGGCVAGWLLYKKWGGKLPIIPNIDIDLKDKKKK